VSYVIVIVDLPGSVQVFSSFGSCLTTTSPISMIATH